MSYYCTRCGRVHSKGKIFSDHKEHSRNKVLLEYNNLKKNQEIYKDKKTKSLNAMKVLDKKILTLQQKKSGINIEHRASVQQMVYRTRRMKELKEKLKKKKR